MGKKNTKESKTKFKEIWSNPRYKALIKLGIYAVFFLILFLISLLSKLVSSPVVVSKNDNSLFDKLTNGNYSYVYTLTTNSDSIIYTGISTIATNSGAISYTNKSDIDKYVVDKTQNITYINGVEQDNLYTIDESYFDLSSIKEKLSNSFKKENDKSIEYIYEDENEININFIVTENNNKLRIEIHFNELYISELIDSRILVLEYTLN